MTRKAKLSVVAALSRRIRPPVVATTIGTRPAFVGGVMYEVLAPGYHSPLTKTQIAKLFHAGRLGRYHRCKQATTKDWRTVDELFPLLKYESAPTSDDSSWEPPDASPRTWGLICAFLVAACAIAALWYYFGYAASSASDHYHSRVTETRWLRTDSTSSTSDPSMVSVPETNQASVSVATTIALPGPTEATRTQIIQQRTQAAEQQRQQAALARIQEERAGQEQKARGQDTIIPLDQYMIVNVGGVGVSVKVHDNDVTTFDVWINGSHYRDVPKQKGISQSRTDETFIYNAGRARLYYVWEISGTLNHARLRVRED